MHDLMDITGTVPVGWLHHAWYQTFCTDNVMSHFMRQETDVTRIGNR